MDTEPSTVIINALQPQVIIPITRIIDNPLNQGESVQNVEVPLPQGADPSDVDAAQSPSTKKQTTSHCQFAADV